MITVTVTMESGFNWTTRMNGDIEKAKAYFVGKAFNVGVYPFEKMEQVKSVEKRITYNVLFVGRENGAIGKVSLRETTIVAVDEKEANVLLYDNFEHISSACFTEMKGKA